MKLNKVTKIILLSITAAGLSVFIAIVGNYLVQRYLTHINVPFVPTYKQVELTKDTDYETFFKQTGLGKAAVDKLIREDNFDAILETQKIFFTEPDVECTPMFGWFTREDRLCDTDGPDFADLQPGDIILTLATHSLGWRHGHAAIVIDERHVLECVQLGTKAQTAGIGYWNCYPNFAVLRLKNITPELQENIVKFCESKLEGRPYKLLSGIFGKKAPDIDDEDTGFYCTNLVWYAFKHFGIDLDSDGGRIVSAYDLLHSDELEIVQLYGMDPRDFINK